MHRQFIFFSLGIVILLGITAAILFPRRTVPTEQQTQPAQRHISAWVRDGYYDPLFAAVDAQLVNNDRTVVAAIVNHHLFAPDLIATTLHAISGAQPSVVVLVSPNHFGIGSGAFVTSAWGWVTMSGNLAGAPELARVLEKTGRVTIDEPVFEKEHGVFNVVTFIRHYFPGAKLLPIIVREQAAEDDIDGLAVRLDGILPADALVIGSFDFSHYKKDAVAQANDAVSMRVLGQLDADHTAGLDIDSTKGLRLLLRYAQLRGATAFHLTGHFSSAERIGDPETTENTSYITGFFTVP
ncbi:MAG: AmmeMemoRadiSam system protein B [Candidatus Kerfeldbacteria bacterium]|nr:AmmeMemoRadiSam system protein B [Candidatus Kerfeldbacteria bacterium]